MPDNTLTVNDLSKVFETDNGPIVAVDKVTFEISGDEFFTMLGPSGCGKTTTLRMIAGLESITSGSVQFNGRDFTDFSAFQRNIGMVFQSYALFPHMCVFDNAAYGLRIRKMPTARIKERVDKVLKLLGLDELAARLPADLSGGQQQRVSIARALVYEPGMLLLDEPLANLDAKLRIEMRQEIRRIQKELGIMTLYVTHDQEEAMSISDRLAVFNLGQFMQAGRPRDIYTNPESLFVADFIGKLNLFPVSINGRDGKSTKVTFSNGHTMSLERTFTVIPQEEGQIAEGFDGMVMVRSEHVEITTTDSGLPCTVQRIEFLGSFLRYQATCPAASRDVIVDAVREYPGIIEGSSAYLSIPSADARLFSRQGGP